MTKDASGRFLALLIAFTLGAIAAVIVRNWYSNPDFRHMTSDQRNRLVDRYRDNSDTQGGRAALIERYANCQAEARVYGLWMYRYSPAAEMSQVPFSERERKDLLDLIQSRSLSFGGKLWVVSFWSKAKLVNEDYLALRGYLLDIPREASSRLLIEILKLYLKARDVADTKPEEDVVILNVFKRTPFDAMPEGVLEELKSLLQKKHVESPEPVRPTGH